MQCDSAQNRFVTPLRIMLANTRYPLTWKRADEKAKRAAEVLLAVFLMRG